MKNKEDTDPPFNKKSSFRHMCEHFSYSFNEKAKAIH